MFYKTLLAVFAVLLVVGSAYGAGTVGLVYSEVAGDRSYGANLAYERAFITGDFRTGELEFDTTIQGGDIYNADYHVEYKFALPFWNLGLAPYLDGSGKGNTLKGLGFKQDVGLALNFALTDEVDVGVGVFGRGGNPLTPKRTATWTDGEWVEDPQPSFLTFKDENTLNALVYTGFEFAGVDLDLKALIELYGKTERVDQLILKAKTGWDLGWFEFNVQGEVGSEWYKGQGTIESAFMAGVSKSW